MLVTSIGYNPNPSSPCVLNAKVCGGEGSVKENLTNMEEREPRGGILSHVLHEKPHANPRIDSTAPTTPNL